MKHLSNVDTSKIEWLGINRLQNNRGGVISDLYYPQTIQELIEVIYLCQNKKRTFYVFGHTSNCYFLPSFSPDAVISTIHLRGYEETENTIIVECGMHSKVLARIMVEKGYEGFEGLIDLPGTISGAIYGNAGCYGCLISDRLISAKVLTIAGEIIEYTKKELGFQERTSYLKERKIKGTILTATFEKVKGDATEINNKAEQAHKDRLATQPGPLNNLGSIFKKDELTNYGIWINRIARYTAKLLHKPESHHSIIKLQCTLAGFPKLAKYLFNLNRFIWQDKNAHIAFKQYLELRKKIFKHNNLEIEIFE